MRIKKHKVLTFSTKVEIINRAESGESLASIACAFNLSHSTVSTIVQNKQKTLDYVKNSGSLNSFIMSKKRGIIMEKMEKLLTLDRRLQQ